MAILPFAVALAEVRTYGVPHGEELAPATRGIWQPLPDISVPRRLLLVPGHAQLGAGLFRHVIQVYRLPPPFRVFFSLPRRGVVQESFERHD